MVAFFTHGVSAKGEQKPSVSVWSGIKKTFRNDPVTPSILTYFGLLDRETLYNHRYVATATGALWTCFAIRNMFWPEKLKSCNNSVDLVKEYPKTTFAAIGTVIGLSAVLSNPAGRGYPLDRKYMYLTCQSLDDLDD